MSGIRKTKRFNAGEIAVGAVAAVMVAYAILLMFLVGADVCRTSRLLASVFGYA